MDKLSIIITFWDGDFHFLHSMYNCIKNNIHIPYEIVLVDNRVDNCQPYPDDVESKCTIVKTGYNASCIPGRIFGAEKATGKYLWFVDVDDEVCFVDDETLLDNREDILSFYSNNRKSDSLTNPLHSEFGNFIYNCGVSIWNKWYRREIFFNAKQNVIDTGLTFYGEDFVYNYYIFYQNKSFKNIELNIYNHCDSGGASDDSMYKMTELFEWQKKANFSQIELQDVHKIYVNFIFQSIYHDLNNPKISTESMRLVNAERKLNFFKDMLIEARDNGWIVGIRNNNKFVNDNVKLIVDKINELK